MEAHERTSNVPVWLFSVLDSSESMGSVLSPNSTPAPPSHVQETDQPFKRHSDHGGAAREPHLEEEDLQGHHALRSGKEHGNGPRAFRAKNTWPFNRHQPGTGQATPTGAGFTVRYGFSTSRDKGHECVYHDAQPRDGQPGQLLPVPTAGQVGGRRETPGDDPQGQGSAGLLHEQDKFSSSQAHQPQGNPKDSRGYASPSPSMASSHSWEKIQTDTMDIFRYLSTEEQTKLMEVVTERQQAIADPVSEEEEELQEVA